MTKPLKSTLRRLEMAALRFHKRWGQWYLDNITDPRNPGLQLVRACAAHAAAKGKRGRKK